MPPNVSQSSSLPNLPGPENIYRLVLDNGIVILARSNFNSPSVVISGYLPIGALYDPDERLGLADFTASALMRGTQQHSFQEIYAALESSGASLGFAGGTHTTAFSGRSLVEDLDMLLGLLLESLRFPTFPQEPIERLRAQLLTRLAIRAQDTAQMASMAFDQVVYDGHPYSKPEDGFPETIAIIQPADLSAFHASYYQPAGMVLAVVGAIEPQQALTLTAQVFSGWSSSCQVKAVLLPSVRQLTTTTKHVVAIPGKSQADLVMGASGPVRHSVDYLAAALGNNILGQFGLYGRIGDVVRVREGLAYYAYSNLSGGIGPGPWYAAAGVDPDNLEKTIDLIQAEILRFVSEPVSEEELEDSKANFIGQLPLSFETNAGMAGGIINLERYDLDLDYYLKFPELIRAITSEEVLGAARKYLHPGHLGIGIAGP